MTAEDRFHVVEQPIASPGHCFISRAAGAAKGPYIDTGVNIRGQHFYICADMIDAMYETLHRNDPPAESVKVPSVDEEAFNNFISGLDSLREITDDLVRLADSNPGLASRLRAPALDESADDAEDSGEADSSSKSTSATSKREKRGGVSSGSGDESVESIINL